MTVQVLCSIKVELLAIFFNGVLISGNLPRIWKRNRTVLIPKAGGILDVLPTGGH